MVLKLAEFRQTMPTNGAGKIDKHLLMGGTSGESVGVDERVEA
jgi:hypothetical protein